MVSLKQSQWLVALDRNLVYGIMSVCPPCMCPYTYIYTPLHATLIQCSSKGAYTPNTIPKAWIKFCHNRNFIKSRPSYRNSFVSRERLINRIGYKGVSFCFRAVVVARPNDPLIKNYAKHESRTRVSLTNTVIVASPFLQIDLI